MCISRSAILRDPFPGHPIDPPSGLKRSEFLAVMDTNVAGVAVTTQVG